MIGYYVHHQGRGHLSRLQAVAAHLDAPVVGLSSLPRPVGWPATGSSCRGTTSPCRPVGDDAAASGVLHWAPRHHRGLRARMAALASWIERAAAGCGGRRRLRGGGPARPAARHPRRGRGPPGRAHGPGPPRRLRPRRRPPRPVAGGGARPGLAGAVGEQDLVRRWPLALRRPAPPPSRPPGGCGGSCSSGAPAGGTPTRRRVEAARTATPGWAWTERSPDRPSPDLWAELCAADVVVTHAGQNAVADVAAARAPAVVVAPTPPLRRAGGDRAGPEPVGNRRRAHLVAGPDRWGDVLDGAHRRGGAGWSRWSTGYGAGRRPPALDALAAGRRPPPDCRDARMTAPGWPSSPSSGGATPTSPARSAGCAPEPQPRLLRRGGHRRPGGPRRGPGAGPGRLGRPYAWHLSARRAGCRWRRPETSAPRRPSPPAPSTWSSSTSTAFRTAPSSAVRRGPGRRDRRAAPARRCAGTWPTSRPRPRPRLAGGRPPATSPPGRPPLPAERDPRGRRRVAVLVAVLRRHGPRLHAGSGASTRTTWGTAPRTPTSASGSPAAGAELLFVGGAGAVHQYHPSPSPPVQHVADIVANANVFADKWGWWPMQSWLDQFHDRGLVRRGVDGRWEVTESESAPVPERRSGRA